MIKSNKKEIREVPLILRTSRILYHLVYLNKKSLESQTIFLASGAME